MESNNKDYTTMLNLRLPISLRKKIEEADLGLTKTQKKRGGTSEAVRLLIMEGLVFRKLKKVSGEPEQMKKIMKIYSDAWRAENKEQYLETLDISELQNISALTNIVLKHKVNQKILDF